MVKAALIVEGKGDVKSVPDLVAKAAAAFDIFLVPSDPPIRSGEALKLRRPGELERYLYLASSREDTNAVYLIVDLDDGCAKEFFEDFSKRAAPIQERFGKPINFCFLVKEYEVLFLNDIDNLKKTMPELGIPADAIVNNPHVIRGAKEKFRELCKSKPYRQARDQGVITKKINVFSLGLADRSFRKLLKCITGKSYEEIIAICEEKKPESQ